MLVGWQHGNDGVGRLHGRTGGRGCRSASLDQRSHGGRRQVKHGNMEAGSHQVTGHRCAHIAQTDKSDMLTLDLLSSITVGRSVDAVSTALHNIHPDTPR